jgi:hypothetical protein
LSNFGLGCPEMIKKEESGSILTKQAPSVTSGLKVYQKQHLKVYHFQRKKLTTL